MKAGVFAILVAICACLCKVGRSEVAPATQPDPAASRLAFLTLRLASTENSIKAINAALKAAGYKEAVAADKAASYKKGNELMDRKGGGPVPWDVFYGRTARAFYVPRAEGSAHFSNGTSKEDVHVASGYHPIARPPQLDYLYRANDEQAAKAQREVALMQQKQDALLARRRQLEDEQSALWGLIALESIGTREIELRPLYRFGLAAVAPNGAAQPGYTPRLEVLKAAVLFLNTTDRFAAAAAHVERAQPQSITALTQGIGQAARALQESILRATASPGFIATDEQAVAKITTDAKQMNVSCMNIAEAYRLAHDGDAAADENRKQTFRAQLQESLLALADATGALDDAISDIARSWGFRGDPSVPSTEPAVPESLFVDASSGSRGGEHVVANDPPGAAGAGGPARADQPTAAAHEFRSAEDVLSVLPSNLYSTSQKEWTGLKRDAANDVLERRVKDAPATFTVKVHSVGNGKRGVDREKLLLTAEDQKAGPMKVYLWFWFDDDQKKALSAVSPGDLLTIKGVMARPRLEVRWGATCLSIDLGHCEIVQPRH